MSSNSEQLNGSWQELDAQTIKAEAQSARLEQYNFMHNLLSSYNRDGIDIRIASFLDYEAKTTLLAMVRTFKDNRIEPNTIVRGFTKGFKGKYIPIQRAGWLITRNSYESLDNNISAYVPVIEYMIVTPGNMVLSHEVPELYINDSVKDTALMRNLKA